VLYEYFGEDRELLILPGQDRYVLQGGEAILRSSPAKALLIDGKAAQAAVLADVSRAAAILTEQGVKPGLAVVLVGEDPASQVYVKSKGNAAQACGFHSIQVDLPAATREAEVVACVERLNADPAIHGILVQLPLPAGIEPSRVIAAISPEKDVDGLHPLNAGRLAIGEIDKALVPCTPAGAMILLRQVAQALGRGLAGAEAVVVGRSNLVGKPIAQLLLRENATVTVAHSRTQDLPKVVGRADILVAAIGRPEMLRGDWIKPGAIVIDVGINRIATAGVDAAGRPKTRLVGDVAFTEALARAAAITPVPGGVGPMTIAMLMANTLRAAAQANPLTHEALGKKANLVHEASES
jgi:methylenetetrahydrofolate dehydrogenase (NADP+)/methenyltetrahydrofolate cyclohydrolase